MTHSYRNSWAVSSGGGERNLRRHGSPNENLAQTSHGRGAGLQPYKFTGKELETTHGQCLYDFGARWLDPLLPRWTSTDPLAEAYYHVSPYAYCAGNPVSFVDPDGMDYFRTFSGALIWRNTHEESRIEDGGEYYNIGNSYILVNHGQSMIYLFRDNSLVGNWSFSEWNAPLPDAPHWQSNPCGSRDEAFIQGTGRYADGGADRFNDFVGVGGGINTALHNVGKSLEKNAGNSTVGNNGKAYWHAKGERGFNGNQHVKTIKLTKVGNMVTKVTGPVGYMLSGFNIYNGYLQDGRQFGYNTALAVGSFVGGWIGASVGLRAGSLAGVTVGGIPGAIIGGATGGTAGAFAGSEMGIMIADKIYRR